MPNVTYYLKSDLNIVQNAYENWQEGGFSAFVGGSTTAFIEAIAGKFRNLPVGSSVAKFLVETSTEYILKEVIIENLENGGAIVRNSQTSEEFVIGSLSSAADDLLVNALVAASGLTAGQAVLFAFGASIAWSGVKEVVEETVQTIRGTTDNSIKLFDQNGEEIGGAFWEYDPVATNNLYVVNDLLENMASRYGVSITPGMTVEVADEHFWSLFQTGQTTFTVYNGDFVDAVVANIFSGNKEAFLRYGASDNENEYKYVESQDVFFAENGQDYIFVPTIFAVDSTNTQFKFDNIFHGSGNLTGNSESNLIIAEASSDIIDAGEGVDYVVGGYGDDTFKGHGTSSGLDGDTYIGGFILYTTATGSIIEATRGVSDGSDWIDYSSLSTGVYVDLTDAEQAYNVNYAYAIDGSGNQIGDRDHLVSIENIMGSSHSDILIGSEADNTIHGGDGFDSLYGGAGEDILLGGSGNNYLNGGDSDDVTSPRSLSEMKVDNKFIIGDTVDYSWVSSGSYVYIDLVGLGSVIDENDNTITVSSSVTVKNSSGTTTQEDTLVSIENIIDTAGDDIIMGTEQSNTFVHTGGSDIYRGGAGDDRYFISAPASGEVIYIIDGDADRHDYINIEGKPSDYEVTTDSGYTIFTSKVTGGEVRVYTDGDKTPQVTVDGSVYVDENTASTDLNTPTHIDASDELRRIDLRSGLNDGYVGTPPTIIKQSSDPVNGDEYFITFLCGTTPVYVTCTTWEDTNVDIYFDGIPVATIENGGLIEYPQNYFSLFGTKPVENLADTLLSESDQDYFFDERPNTYYGEELNDWSDTQTIESTMVSYMQDVYAAYDVALSSGSWF